MLGFRVSLYVVKRKREWKLIYQELNRKRDLPVASGTGSVSINGHWLEL